MRLLYSALFLVLQEADPVFVAGYSYPHDEGPEIDAVLLTDALVVTAQADKGELPVVSVIPRSALRGLRVLEAPNIVLPSSGLGESRTSLRIALDFDGHDRLELPARNPSPAQRDAVQTLLPTLLQGLASKAG